MQLIHKWSNIYISYVVPNWQEVMSGELSEDILNVKAIGSEIYHALRQERLTDKSKKISDTIHRTNIKGFNRIQKKGKKEGSWICSQNNGRYHNGKGDSNGISLTLLCLTGAIFIWWRSFHEKKLRKTH